VRIQLPLALSEYDEPFPDLAVVSGSPRDYLAQHPTSALLVVEVSEASLKTDREVKGSLYASAGIPEYWILNLRERVLEVYREPTADARAVYGAADVCHFNIPTPTPP
jgi:Uma2 family endonuclease